MLDYSQRDDVADATMRSDEARLAAVRSERDYVVAYLDDSGQLQHFPFTGRPTQVLTALEERGVDIVQGKYARSWYEAGDITRHYHGSDDIVAQLAQALDAEAEAEADQARAVRVAASTQ